LRIFSLPAGTALRILFAFGFGFFLSMFTRAVANIIKPFVQADLGLSEEVLGLSLGTTFFVAFGLMQLPLGVLLDRYDPRKVNAALMLVAAAGAAIFAVAEDAAMLAVGRVLMGLGFAAAMMASLKTYSLWFPVDSLPSVTGLQFAVGILGVISATKPTAWALQVMEWRDLTLIFSGLTVLAAIVLVTVPPGFKSEGTGESLRGAIAGLKRIYTDAFFWRIIPWMTLSVGMSQGIGTLYVFSWLTDVADYSASKAATVLFLNASIAVLNFAAMGPAAQAFIKRGASPLIFPVTGLLVCMAAMVLLVVQWTTAAIPVWLVWTLAIGTNVLMFSVLAQAFPVSLAGRVYTAVNVLSFAFTAIAQWSVGLILDLFPNDVAFGYKVAFGVLLGVQSLGAVWYFVATRLGYGAMTMVQKEAAAMRGA